MPWSRQFLTRVMLSPATRAALDRGADEIAGFAVGILASEKIDQPVHVEHGVRPGGRPYARVAVPGSQEWGDGKTPRLRVLGRAAVAAFPGRTGAPRRGRR